MNQPTAHGGGQDDAALSCKRIAGVPGVFLLILLMGPTMGLAQSHGEGVVPSGPAERARGGSPIVPVAAPEASGTPRETAGEDGAAMLLIPAGEFVMGAPEGVGEDDERPQHSVWIDAFYLDKFEVTTGLYEVFLEATGHLTPEFWPYEELSQYGDRPVVGVGWNGARAYCEWTGKRLPTEAEWEYAARGNDGRRYPWGDAEPDKRLANYAKSWSYQFYKDRVEAGGSREDNKSPFGVHDMAGNVWEWVEDWYDPKYYARSPEKNPPGPESGSMKVLRGGSWNFSTQYLRATARLKYNPRQREADVGFRCARDAG